MVNYKRRLDATFSALSDGTRRAILARLADGEVRVGELAAGFRISWPAVTKHLRVLQKAGLLVQQRDGRIRRCRLRAEPMRDAAQWIEHYRKHWTRQLDGLAKFLETPVGATPPKVRPKRKEKTSRFR